MKWYHFLVIFPLLALTVGIYYANRVEPFVMGLPFFNVLDCGLGGDQRFNYAAN
ncbi:hypothetical protein PY546_09935 [Providencia stuartii]|nr:hypothetical protein [Providencia stuartii]